MFYAVVLAGGGGTRFWPKSRKTRPKQLLDIIGSRPLISQTVERLEKLFSREMILVVTQEAQLERLRELVDLPEGNILAEPQSKNTAAAIGLAALEVRRRSGDEAAFAALPSDHYIADPNAFLKTLLIAKELALEGYLVTIGIRPRYPETGYGYIEIGERLGEKVHLVRRFVEKPDLPTAKEFFEQGNYLWNSGTFIWKVKTLMEALKLHMPALHDGLEEIARSGYHFDVIRRIYNEIPDISIDYGLMERADPGKVAVVIGEYGWSDVGSWLALGELLDKDEQGNVVRGEVVGLDCSDSILYSDDGLIGAVGLEGMIVVFSEGAVLVCPKERAQEVRHLVKKLEQLGKGEHI